MKPNLRTLQVLIRLLPNPLQPTFPPALDPPEARNAITPINTAMSPERSDDPRHALILA